MLPPFINPNKLVRFRDDEEKEADEEDTEEEDDEEKYKDFWYSKIRLILSF